MICIIRNSRRFGHIPVRPDAISATNQFGLIQCTGIAWGSTEALVKEKINFRYMLFYTGRNVATLGGAGVFYSIGVNSLGQYREKDDLINHMFGGILAGLPLGARSVLSTVVLEGPTNISVLAGTDATLKCTIQSQTEGQFVFWKRLNSTGHVDKMVSYNNHSINNDLYTILGYYNLLIKNPTIDSEGLYQCDTGNKQFVATLAVSVPMQNMSIYWGPVIPYTLNTWTNITCQSIRSRPAANLRWFHGSSEITSKANSFFKDTGPDGYGDSISIIEVQVTSSQVPYRCVADLPGRQNIRTEFIFPPVTGAAVGKSGNSYLSGYGYQCFVLVFLFRIINSSGLEFCSNL